MSAVVASDLRRTYWTLAGVTLCGESLSSSSPLFGAEPEIVGGSASHPSGSAAGTEFHHLSKFGDLPLQTVLSLALT